MSSVPQHLRARIDSAADELVSIAERLGPDHRALAELYAAIGAGLKSTHYKTSGGHLFGFEVPEKCFVGIEGKRGTGTKIREGIPGPVVITIFAISTFWKS